MDALLSPARGVRARAWLSALVGLWSLLALAGCTVNFVAPYDAVFDERVSHLHGETSAFLARIAATNSSYKNNAAFYQETAGRIAALRARAELYSAEKNKGTLSLLDALAANFKNLELLHEEGPLTGAVGRHARELLESNFRSLLQVELAKKRSSGVSPPARSS